MSQRTVVVELRVGESVRVGEASVRLQEKSGQRAKLVISASAGVVIEPPAKRRASDVARLGVMPAPTSPA